MDTQDLASWIRIHKNMRIHRFGSKGQNDKYKLQKKKFTLETLIRTVK